MSLGAFFQSERQSAGGSTRTTLAPHSQTFAAPQMHRLNWNGRDTAARAALFIALDFSFVGTAWNTHVICRYRMAEFELLGRLRNGYKEIQLNYWTYYQSFPCGFYRVISAYTI